MFNGYKKLIAALLTMLVIGFSTFFGKELDIDVNGTADALFAVVGVVYMIAQAIHDVAKEKNTK